MKIAETTVQTDLDGELVLMNVDTGTFYALKDSGLAIWEQIEKGVAAEDIPARLTETFMVDETTARTDVAAFIADLTAAKLLDA